MNKDIFEGNWEQLKGHVKQKWGKLTDDTLTRIEGSRQVLEGKIQEAYGISIEEAQKQVREFAETHSEKEKIL